MVLRRHSLAAAVAALTVGFGSPELLSKLKAESELSTDCYGFPQRSFSRQNCVKCTYGTSPHVPVSVGDCVTDFTLPNIDGTGSFRSLQEYPCDLDVKIIGTNEGPFVTDMVTICAENCGMAEADVKARWRDKGKYRAITLRLHFESAEQVYAVYAAINRDPRVKFKL